MKDLLQRQALTISFIVATAAMLGSLYFSEIMGYAPCVLCWYQRIAMYPLVVIFAVAILRRDRRAWAYALPLSIAGTAIAVYHNLLQWEFISASLSPCQFGISCATRTIIALNFITIPLLSLVSFVLIAALMFIYRTRHIHE